MKEVLSWAWLAALVGVVLYGDVEGWMPAMAITAIFVALGIICVTFIAIDSIINRGR